MASEPTKTQATKRTYQQEKSYREFCEECGVRKMERYDDCILLTTKNLTVKVPHEFFSKVRPMIVREGNAP